MMIDHDLKNIKHRYAAQVHTSYFERTDFYLKIFFSKHLLSLVFINSFVCLAVPASFDYDHMNYVLPYLPI